MFGHTRTCSNDMMRAACVISSHNSQHQNIKHDRDQDKEMEGEAMAEAWLRRESGLGSEVLSPHNLMPHNHKAQALMVGAFKPDALVKSHPSPM